MRLSNDVNLRQLAKAQEPVLGRVCEQAKLGLGARPLCLVFARHTELYQCQPGAKVFQQIFYR
jgi:hypothetical protein